MTQRKRGFTIIEVVLVLAVAGLIFMMVFVALPALQSSQRDTQRRDDLARFQTSVIRYQSNNRGRLPWEYKGGPGVEFSWDDTVKFIEHYMDNDSEGWEPTFNATDVSNGAKGCSDGFMDPDGTCYGISPIGTGAYHTAGESYDIFENIEEDGEFEEAFLRDFSHMILLEVSHASCGPDEAQATASVSFRDFAAYYVLEGGSVICVDNS